MKKIYSLIIAAAFAVVAIPAFASTPDDLISAATKASASRNYASGTPNITDASSGNTAEVSTKGNLYVRESTKEIETTQATAEVIKGACTVYDLTVTGGNLAEQVMLIDSVGLDTMGFKQMPAALIEVEVTVANSTIKYSIPGGVLFKNGVCMKQTGSDNKVVMIQFDTDTRS